MKNKKMMLLLAAVTALSLGVCGEAQSDQPVGADSQAAADTQTDNAETQLEPVTIENFNMETTYDFIPERIVSLSYSETEILVALGLGDKIAGIAEAENTSEVVLEKYRAEVEKLNVFASAEDGNGVPTLEAVLSLSPDFVYGTSYSFNENFGVGTVDDFQNNGIKVYATTSTYKSGATLEDTYQDILNIGAIFRVEDKAQELVDELKAEISAIQEKVADTDPVTVFIYGGGQDAPIAYLGTSYQGYLTALVGGENVFPGDETTTASRMSWEAIVEANPDCIIFVDRTDTSWEENAAFLKSLPELQNVTAIKEENFVAVPTQQYGFGGLSNVEAVQTLAEGLHPECFE